MSRNPQTFQQRDVTRLLKAARAAGEDVARVEIESGKIALILGERLAQNPQAASNTGTTNEWDIVLR
jgi:hypothetical protein